MGNAPFHDAVYFTSTPLEIIQILTDSGRVDYAICNKRGLNALHLAIRRRNTEYFLFMFKLYYIHIFMIVYHFYVYAERSGLLWRSMQSSSWKQKMSLE